MEWLFWLMALGGFLLLGYLFWPKAEDVRPLIHWKGDDGLIYSGRVVQESDTQLYYLVELSNGEKIWIGLDKLV